MGNLNIKLGYDRQSTEIPSNFIEHYTASCPPVYALVYIFSIKRLLNGENTSTAELAGRFNITEGDVLNAWNHWESAGLVTFDAKNKSITFLPVGIPEKVDTAPPASKPIMGVRPQYSIEELTLYRQQNRDIARLFSRAEKTLGKLLYYTDMNIIFGFYDWLRLPLDVVEYLLNYCEENGHRNLRYIEKCAMDWADNDITDLEKALNYVQAFDKNYRTILHYMGQTTAYPTPSHRKFMDKWLDDWKMPLDLIMEACDRSVAQINKPKFSYVDGILAKWHKANICDIAAVKAADAAFAKENEIVPINSAPDKPKTNRFVNFNQRENDYSKFEQMEREYLQQKLK